MKIKGLDKLKDETELSKDSFYTEDYEEPKNPYPEDGILDESGKELEKFQRSADYNSDLEIDPETPLEEVKEKEDSIFESQAQEFAEKADEIYKEQEVDDIDKTGNEEEISESYDEWYKNEILSVEDDDLKGRLDRLIEIIGTEDLGLLKEEIQRSKDRISKFNELLDVNLRQTKELLDKNREDFIKSKGIEGDSEDFVFEKDQVTSREEIGDSAQEAEPSSTSEEEQVQKDQEKAKDKAEVVNNKPENAPANVLGDPDPEADYHKEKERKLLAKKKRLKDPKKKQVIGKFRAGEYENLKRAIEGRFHGDKNEDKREFELRALEEWTQEQKSLIEGDKLSSFEDYWSYRSVRTLGGEQVSGHRVDAIKNESYINSIEKEIDGHRKKMEESYKDMKKAESLGDEENRVKYERSYRAKKAQLRHFSSYMFAKRQDKMMAKGELSFNKWAARYDEKFRPKSAFGFFRQRFNLKVYREIFDMRYWPGYFAGFALYGLSKGLDWGFGKLRGISANLKKNKLFDWGKLKPAELFK